jgi:hypothetical protein
MCAMTILTTIDQGRLQIGQIFVLCIDGSFVDHRAIERHKMLQRLRRSRHGGEKARHVPEDMR